MTKVSLYHADWCPHCHQFMPTWEALQGFFKENGVETATYEHGTDAEAVKQAGVKGFPTIKISEGNKEYDYKGPRDAQSIIGAVLPDFQIGGAQIFQQYQEYRKYKQMYLDLVNQK